MTAPPPPCTEAEALLSASRRVDWRFLLPDPNLGRVAYLGPAQGELAASLRLFSASLTVVGRNIPQGEVYEVVVTHEPTGEMLAKAAGLVRPGGFLYLEGYGLLGLARRGSSLRQLNWNTGASYTRTLEGLGFSEIQAHWHWPNFEACTKIIPLHDQGALLFALGVKGSGLAGLVKNAFGRGIARSGLLARLAPCFSLVARRLELCPPG